MAGKDQYYQILEIKPGASKAEIKEAYRILAKVWHPDRFPNDLRMQELANDKLKQVNIAYQKLLSAKDSFREGGEVPRSKLEIRSKPIGASVIRPGRYVIRIIMEGYDIYEGTVEIKNETQKVINAFLKQKPKEGRLVVRSDPSGATVVLDEQVVGMTAFEKRLANGVYRVLVISDGYEIWERNVTIRTGKTEEILAQLKWKEQRPGEIWKDPFLGMEFIFIKGGSFEMGDIFGRGKENEKPLHEESISDFFMGRYQVTQGQWKKIMNDNPCGFKRGNNYPVEMVSWFDVKEFIGRLNLKTRKKYRLPTEGEWEYAARSGGKKEKWAGTNNESELCLYAWYSGNSEKSTHPVGHKTPNGLGLYDMSGNVWEWTGSLYAENYSGIGNASRFEDNQLSERSNKTKDKQSSKSQLLKAIFPLSDFIISTNSEDPLWEGKHFVIRGGSWFAESDYLRTTYRGRGKPKQRVNNVGFRLVCSI
jgi:formylglycine-generating enzyme required for sulfatase activity